MNQRADVPKARLRVVRAIPGFMKTLIRHTVIALAALVLVAAGCGGTGDAEKAAQRAAEEDRQQTQFLAEADREPGHGDLWTDIPPTSFHCAAPWLRSRSAAARPFTGFEAAGFRCARHEAGCPANAESFRH